MPTSIRRHFRNTLYVFWKYFWDSMLMWKGYALPFTSDPRPLFKIGINFQTDTKLIDDWEIA